MSEERKVYYMFEHRLLPGWFFNDPEWFVEQLKEDGKLFVHYMWTKACEQLDSKESISSSDIDVSFHKLSSGYWAVIKCPDPIEMTEAYFVAVCASSKVCRTLEYSKDHEGNPRTVYGGWTADGTHLNLGGHSGTSLDEFVTTLAKK